MSNSLDSIRVAIRVRPLITRELNDCRERWLVDGDTICQVNDEKKVPNTTFTFDRIFSQDHSTFDLYADFAKPIVLSVMEGINGTLFAYGQTSSGKTYTMTGTPNNPGIIPYALQEVFDYISNTQNREFLLRVSYMEIYNENITDLLQPKSTHLKIRENANREISVEKLTEKVVTNVEQIIGVLQIGDKSRHFGGTNMNERSSRSHTIFRMVAESRETSSRASVDGGEFAGAVKVSQLNLVDLAGSERASQTGAEGLRLREGGFINKSLFTLGNVINKLIEGESAFVPFRDSKLTRILQNSLGGNTKTSIICAVTPASTDETLSTLQFASRAKRIKNRPEVNEVLDDGTMLKRCRREISELKLRLEKSHSREEVLKRENELHMEKDMIQKELEEQRRIADETKAKLRELTNVFCTSQPKENPEKQRKQRRWTVCPMGANRGPLLQLDLPSTSMPPKRLDRTYAGSPSRSLGDVSCVDFSVDRRDRFLEELRDKEEILADQSALIGAVDIDENHPPVNASEARIAELESEVKRITQERDALCEEHDALRNDLSENITSSSEMQEELLRTKDKLKGKRRENRELQEQLEALKATSVVDDNKENCVNESPERKRKYQELVVVEQKASPGKREPKRLKDDTSAQINEQLEAIASLKKQLELALAAQETSMKDHEETMAKLRQEFEGKLGEKNTQLGDLMNEVKQLNEMLPRGAKEASTSSDTEESVDEQFTVPQKSVDELIRKFEQELLRADLELQQKSLKVENLCKLNAEEHGEMSELVNNLREELYQKSEQVQEKICEIEHLKLSISNGDNELQEDLTPSDVNLHERLTEAEQMAEVDPEKENDDIDEENDEFDEENHEIDEVKRQLAEALAAKDRLRSEHSADFVDLQEKYETALTEITRNLQDKCKEVERLNRKVKCETIPTLVENPEAEALEEELGTARIDLESAFEEITVLKGELETARNLIKESESHVAEGKTQFREENSLLKVKLEAVNSEKNDLAKEDEDRVSELFYVDVGLLKEELQAAVIEKDDLVKSNEARVAEVETQFQKEISLLKEKLEAVISEKNDLKRENEARVSEPFHVDVALLREELQAAVFEKENLVKNSEACVAEVGTQFREEISLSKEKLEAVISEKNDLKRENEARVSEPFHVDVALLREELQAAVFEKENLVKYREACVAEVGTQFREEISLLKEKLEAVISEKNDLKRENEARVSEPFHVDVALLREELQAAVFEKEDLVKVNEARVAEVETQFREEISLLKEKLEAVISEKNDLKRENEARISEPFHVDVALLREELQAAVFEKEDLVKINEARVAEVETQFREEISLLKEKLKAVISEKSDLEKEYEARVSEVETRFHEEIRLLQEKLQGVVSEKEELAKENEAQVSDVEARFRDELEKKEAEASEERNALSDLKTQMDALISEKDQLRKANIEYEEKLRELCVAQAELENQKVQADELRKEYISEKDDMTKELLGIQGTLDAALAKKDSEIEDILSMCANFEGELQEAISSKDTLIEEHQAAVVRLEDEFSKELDQMRCTAEESSKVIAELRENLRKTESASFEREELALKLKEKDEIIATNSTLVCKLKEEIEELTASKEKVLEEQQTITESLKNDFDDQIENLRQAVMEKERELIRSQEENVNALRADLDREREQLNARVNESASKIHELDNNILEKEIEYEETVVENSKLKEQVENLVCEAKQISHDLNQKTNRIRDLESELGQATQASECKTEKRDSLQNDLNSTAEELNRTRDDLRAKSDEVSTLEKKVEEVSKTIESLKQDNEKTVEQLQEQNDILKTDLEELLGEHQKLKTDSETHEARVKTETDMESQSPVASCKDCRRRSGIRQGRRESEVFKVMLQDIKEQVDSKHIEQDKLIEELNHTLVATQERLQEKEFELDEKEIGAMEKDELAQNLQEKLKVAEEELLQAKRESEMAIEKLTHETNAFQEKIRDCENVLSEEQVTELYRTMEEKSRKIADLEEELSEVPRKDSKIAELEMEIDILEGEITSLKGRSDGDQQSIQELQQMLREQEKHIVQLEACKADLMLEREEAIEGELRDLRAELEGARSRLVGFEEEKSRGVKMMQEKTELLEAYDANVRILEENIENKDKELREAAGKLERAQEDVNQRDISKTQTAQELEKSEAALKGIQASFKTISDQLKRSNDELNEQRSRHDEVIQKLNRDVQVSEGAFKKAMNNMLQTNEVVKEKEAECEGYKEKIRDLEIQQSAQSEELAVLKSRHISITAELEQCKTQIMQLDEQHKNRIAELTNENCDNTPSAGCQGNDKWTSEKETELAKVKEENKKALKYAGKKEKEARKLELALQECEGELSEMQNKLEDLEEEHEDLKTKQDNATDIKQLVEDSHEADILRPKVSSLEAEVARLREMADPNLEEELKKAKNDLKTKELDFFQLDYEKTNQLDNATNRLRDLEKDVANYARKNNGLKAEIRSLRNRGDEPTMTHSKPQSSSNGENAGVVGSVALFTLNARVEKLGNENKELQNKSVMLQKEIDKLGLINVDFKQRYSQITVKHEQLTEKYNRLKEKFVNNLETQKKMEDARIAEQSTGGELQACGQLVQPAIRSQNNDPSFGGDIERSQSAFKEFKRVPEFCEQESQRVLKDGSSGSAFRHHTGNSVFKPSNESAFKKPLDKPSSAAGPIPSHPASKPVGSSIGLPRRVVQQQVETVQAGRKKTVDVGSDHITVGAMQQNNKTTKESSSLDKPRKTTFSKQNKENSLFATGEKPDACKTQ